MTTRIFRARLPGLAGRQLMDEELRDMVAEGRIRAASVGGWWVDSKGRTFVKVTFDGDVDAVLAKLTIS